MNKTKSFEFKAFTIHGGNSGMPVSTDGVLLGAWATIEYANTILDIGTGTGLLALMCAQRNPHAKINAIDINHEAIVAATHNVELSPWNDRIQLQQIDVSQLIAPKNLNILSAIHHILILVNRVEYSKEQSLGIPIHSVIKRYLLPLINCYHHKEEQASFCQQLKAKPL